MSAPHNSHMNIYQIFVTVVQLGGFSAAAKKLHRSPSSISKKISLLEERLNVQLFDRTTRNLEITEAGVLYYERCRDIAQRIEDAESELTGLLSKPAGTITLTWPNTISSSSVVDVLEELNTLYPDIHIDVVVDNNQVNLIDHKIDFAFRMDPAVESNMVAIELFQMIPIICASPAYIDAYGRPDCISGLETKPLLLLNNASAIQKFWKTLPGLKNIEIDQHNRVNDINALHHMVIKGMGATMMFRHMVERELENGSLIDLFPDAQFASHPVYLMFHKNNHMPAKIQVFLNHFKKHYLGPELY